jgi:hypothetical protein
MQDYIVTGFYSFDSIPTSVICTKDEVRGEVKYLLNEGYKVGVLEINRYENEPSEAVEVFTSH